MKIEIPSNDKHSKPFLFNSFIFIILSLVILLTVTSYTQAATIISSEYFIDADPGEGLGVPIPMPIDGTYDSANEQVQFAIDTSTVKIGRHTVYVRMKNSDGSWGIARPILNDMEFAAPYNIEVTGNKIITAAEYFIDVDSGAGNGTPVQPADGVFDNGLEGLSILNLNTSVLSTGLHTLYLRAKDNNGDWGVLREYTFEVRGPNVISGGRYAIDFDPVNEETVFVDDFSAGETWTENQGTGVANSGVYNFTLTNKLDPYFYKNTQDFDESLKYLVITYRSYANGPNAITPYYTDGTDCATFNAICSQSFSIINDGLWHTLTAEVTDPEWIDNDGTITQLRFDLDGATALGTFSVDDIHFANQTLSQALTPADGAFNGTVETGSASLNTSGLSAGGHTLYLRMRDATGWSPLVTYSLGVNAPSLQLFTQPVQTPNSSGLVPFTARVEDHAAGTYRMKVEYSTNGTAWNNASLSGALVDNTQAFQVGPIATNGGGVNLPLTWLSAPNLPDQELSDVKLRLTIDNSAGRTAQTVSSGFDLDNHAPPIAVLISPSDNIQTNDKTPLFVWQNVETGVSYRLQVDNNSDFSSPVIDQSNLANNFFAVLSSIAPAHYFWRVKATDAMGNQGAFSPAYDFWVLGDTTRPSVALTYGNNPAAIGPLLITATFSEGIDTIPAISINQQGTVDITGAAMSGSGSVWTYIYDVHKANGAEYIDGTANVTIGNAKDAAGNSSLPATNNTFTINTSQPPGIIVAAEYFIDTDPGEGLGVPILTPVDGVYDSANEKVDVSINTGNFKIGRHTVYVRMKNSDGSWGIARPILNDMEFAAPYNVEVTGNKIITAAEYFIDVDPGAGNGTPVQPADGVFDNGLEGLSILNLNTSILPTGLHTLYLRAKDNNGDWGVLREYTFEVRGPNLIQAAEYFIDNGTPVSLTSVDGVFDEGIETALANLNSSTLTAGGHTLSLRMRDATGWSPLVTYSLGVNAPMVQFTSQPVQTTNSAGTVPFTARVEDYAGSNTYRMKVEYSSDGTTWKKSALSGALVDNSQAFQVGPIATSSGGVNLPLSWMSATNLPDVEYPNVTIMLTLDNSAGRTAETVSNGFELDNQAPPVAVLLSPADNLQTNDPTPLFLWQGAEEGAKYRLQVDNHSDFSSPVIDQTSLNGNSFTTLSDLFPRHYFWRVKATDAMGNQSAFSPAYDFWVLGDTTRPSVAMTYSNNPAAIGPLLITAAFSEGIDTVPVISINQQGTVDIPDAAMSGSGSVWTYVYDVHKSDGTGYIDGPATVTIGNAKDAAGNLNLPATNDTFTINTSQPSGIIVAAEYFIDTDPGEGLGIQVPAPMDGIYDSANEQVQFNVNTSTLRIGRHTVYLRMKNSNGAWGIARPIINDMELASPYNLNIEGNRIITAAEYFIDTDPGQGNGVPVQAKDGVFDGGIEDLTLSGAGMPALSKGLHTLYVRAKDINGDWGPAREYTFEVVGPVGGIITATEYYIDTDPGAGSGTVLKADDGSYDEVYEQSYSYLKTSTLSVGDHQVCARAQNSGGTWGNTTCEDLSIGVVSTCLPMSGILKDAITNKPLSDVTVKLDNGVYATVTDTNGFYNFACIPNGTHIVTAIVPTGYVPYSRTIGLPLNAIWDIKLTKDTTVNGTNTNSGYSIDPVNTATGNYTYQRNDIEINGIGLPFEFERSYNSRDAQDGPLGFGWVHNYTANLGLDMDSAVTIRWGDGKTETWTPDNSGGFTPQYGVFDTLTDNGNGQYTLKKKDMTRYKFDTTGRLISISDKNGNAISLTYTGKGLTKITDTAGRIINLQYNSGDHITLITDPAGRTIRFIYDVNGDLVSATDMNNNTTQYTYDSNHQILSVIDPKGNILVSNVYDDLRRVVVSQKDAKNGETQYIYNETDNKTTVTDALGNTTIHYHDALLRLVQEVDARNKSMYYTYDGAGNRTKIKDKNSNITLYAYDSRGNVISKTDALNGVTAITYDANNNPLTKTDALGNITKFDYDAKGNLKKTTYPSIPPAVTGFFTTIVYDTHGLPAAITDAMGNTTISTYDSQGNLIEITDVLGNTAFTATYDGVGRKLTEINHGVETSYTYDNNDNILTITDVRGVITNTYDQNDNKTSVTDRMGYTTQYSYDVKDLLTTITDPNNKTINYTYDGIDRKTSVTDKNSNDTGFTYDKTGNLLRITDPLNNKSNYTYDANGNKLTETDSLGNTTAYTYDALNRLISVTDPLVNTTTTAYDALGRVSSTTNAKLQTTSFEYDAVGRLIKVTDSESGIVQYTYDDNGNRLTMTDPNNHTTQYSYDALNRLVVKTEPVGGQYTYSYDVNGNVSSLTKPDGNTINYTYDGLNRLTKTIYPDTTFVSYIYDANDNRTALVDASGTSTYSYDGLNRMLSYTDPYGNIVGYGYDFNGNRTSITYPDGKTVQYVYDQLNRLTTVTDWLGKTTTYNYDSAGKLTGIVNPNNSSAVYDYDTAGRLIGLTNKKSDASIISGYSFSIDAIGNHTSTAQDEPLVAMIPGQSITYSYDTENRMTDAGGVVNTFDANGNMTAKGSNTFIYDYNDRLMQSNVGGVLTQYSYDGMGNRLVKTEGGVTTRYVQDINGSLSNVLAETDAGGAITAYYVYGLGLISKVLPDGTAYYYHYDSRGSTVALTDAVQNVTDSYTYDPFGNVVNRLGVTVNPFRYVGRYGLQDEGNGLTYIRARYYVPALGRFITKDPLTGKDGDTQSLNRYVYAVNNPVMLVDVSGLSAKEASKNKGGSIDRDVSQRVIKKILRKLVTKQISKFGTKLYQNGVLYGPKSLGVIDDTVEVFFDRAAFGYLLKKGAVAAGLVISPGMEVMKNWNNKDMDWTEKVARASFEFTGSVATSLIWETTGPVTGVASIVTWETQKESWFQGIKRTSDNIVPDSVGALFYELNWY